VFNQAHRLLLTTSLWACDFLASEASIKKNMMQAPETKLSHSHLIVNSTLRQTRYQSKSKIFALYNLFKKIGHLNLQF